MNDDFNQLIFIEYIKLIYSLHLNNWSEDHILYFLKKEVLKTKNKTTFLSYTFGIKK